jgi:hypothetical protein
MMIKRARKFDSRSQTGVTLLLAVLVLAAITAIAFSLATIIFIEIRASGDVMRTEPALYAVQGLSEEAFYKYARGVPDSQLSITDCTPTSLNVCSLNGVSMNQPLPSVRVFDPAPRLDTIKAAQTVTYPFIDPNNPNSFTPIHQNFSLTYLNSGTSNSLNVIVYRYDTQGNKTAVQPGAPAPVVISPGGGFTYNITDNGQYELVLNNQANIDNSSILVQLDAQRTNGNREIPLVGKQVLDIRASYLGLTRKYEVILPLQ